MRILADDDQRHGVRVLSRGFTGVTFRSAGTVGTLTASAPVSVQVRQRRDGTAVRTATFGGLSGSHGATHTPKVRPA